MGKDQEKSGFLSSNWMTVILIVVLIVLAVVFILIVKNPKQFDIFKGCGKKKEAKPDLVPVGWDFQNPDRQFSLLLVEERLKFAS